MEQVEEGNIITLEFLTFALEDEPQNAPCPYDKLEIYDGFTTQSKLLDSLCGAEAIEDIKSSSNHLGIM